MRTKLPYLVMLSLLVAFRWLSSAEEISLNPRKPLPPGAVEHVGAYFGPLGSILRLKSGELLLAVAAGYRLSKDGGVSWSEPRKWNCPVPVSSLLRLKSGVVLALGFTGDDDFGFQGQLSHSPDEGKTWGPVYTVPLASATYPMDNSLIQLRSGRLLLPGGMMLLARHPEKERPLGMDLSGAWGTWRGQRMMVESEAHQPQIVITFVYYSDDEGKTWSPFHRWRTLMAWFDEQGEPNGRNGVTDVNEPYVAETKDGKVLLFGRNQTGRVISAQSEDGGVYWTAIRPTTLASSYSPAFLKRLPQTGDLLCVWNQVSREEIERGYRRGRLSAAISKDNGQTWTNFKTLELSDGLKDLTVIEPELPLTWVKARKDIGVLPDSWAYFHYPNVDIVDNKVFVRYFRGSPLLGVADQDLHKQENVMRVYPLEWFCK